MNGKPEAPAGAKGPLPIALGALALLALIGLACGISLGAAERDMDIFVDLTVEGDFTRGGDLLLILEYSQQYDVAVPIWCDLLWANEDLIPTPNATATPTATLEADVTPTSLPIPRRRPTPVTKVVNIFNDVLSANEDGGPVGEATPAPGVIQRAFQAPSVPGEYVVRCFTPGDANNVIFEDLPVLPYAIETPRPGQATPEV